MACTVGDKPHEFRPQTRMPQFFFNEDQGKAIAAYLLKVSKEEGNEWLASRPQPDGIDPSNPEQVEKGKALVNSVGCRGCHIVENGQTATLIGSEKTYAPILARIAEKTNPRWLYYWIRNPREYSPHTAMPSLRLTDDEAKSIVSYLMTLGENQPNLLPDLTWKMQISSIKAKDLFVNMAATAAMKSLVWKKKAVSVSNCPPLLKDA